MDENKNGRELDLSKVFTSGKFKRVSQQFTKEQKYYPNELWHADEDRVVLVLALKSNEGDFALNAKVLSDLRARVSEGRIHQAYVVFSERDGRELRPVSYRSVEDISGCLNDTPTINGRHGPYWWVNPELALGVGYVPADLRPF